MVDYDWYVVIDDQIDSLLPGRVAVMLSKAISITDDYPMCYIHIIKLIKYNWFTVVVDQNIEAEAKWPPFSRRYFQMHFLELKCMDFD